MTVIFSKKYFDNNVTTKNNDTARIYVDGITPLPRHRYRLTKIVGNTHYSFVVHRAALRLDTDAVSIYRRCGYMTLSYKVAGILLGLDSPTSKHVIKVTAHGPSTSLFDAPRSVVLDLIFSNNKNKAA